VVTAKKGGLAMQKKKRMVRTLFIVALLSVIMLFFDAGQSLSFDSPLVEGWGGIDFENSKNFSEWLRAKKIKIVTFVDENGSVYISNVEYVKEVPVGKLREIEPCTENCPNLRDKKILRFYETATFVVTGSPTCILIKGDGFRMWWDVVENKKCKP